MSGLTQRRKNANSSHEDVSNTSDKDGSPNTVELLNSQSSANDQDDASRFTLLEEVILLGLKDNEVLLSDQGMLSFWNDNISVHNVKESRKRPLAERLLTVKNESPTGEVLLDEALRYIKADSDSIGETWNITKIGYQLKQVRERISKGLVEKGVLRTEKRSFILFDIPTHPVQDSTVKERLVQRVVDCLLGRGAEPDRRTIACVCSAYAANVLENALVGLSHSQRETAFQRVDELLQDCASYSEKARASGVTEVMAG